jgi:DNA replication protein DnaC
MSSLTDPIGPDLTATLRALKLGKLTATLPERLTLARQTDMPHADFLQLILSDEVARREAGSIALRAKNAGLDPAMRTETWDPTAAIRYDQRLWNELVSLRFLDGPHGALILGPVGVGKTHLATALGHIAVRRRRTVHMARADKLFKRLTAARLDNTLDYEYRRLTTSSCSSSMILPFSPSPPPRPPTSTRSSPNATAKPPPWSPPTATPASGSRS